MMENNQLRSREHDAIARAEANGASKLCGAFICDKESAARAATATRGSALASAAAALR